MALIVQGKPAAVEMCLEHKMELIEAVQDATGQPCRVLSEGFGVPWAVVKIGASS